MDLAELIVAAPSVSQGAKSRLDRVLQLVESTRALACEIELARIHELAKREVCRSLECEACELLDASAEDANSSGWLATRLVAPSDDAVLGVLRLSNKLDGVFDEFDERLLEAFGRHVAAALDRARKIDQLQRKAENEFALNVARDIQLGFTPRTLPQMAEYEIATWWTPNEAVGGDYCDAVVLPDGRLALVIADVSGHGLVPSLIMASGRAALRALMLEHCAPDKLLERLSKAIATELENGHFITALIACVDSATHRIEFANAGHAPAEHYCPTTDCFAPLASTAMPIGVGDDGCFAAGPGFALLPGDLIVLCTDGIIEALDAHDQPFGMDRLKQLVRQHRDAPLDELVGQIATRVHEHHAGELPSDDVTILAVRRKK